MRSKEEQLIRSMGIIEDQAKELIETYGWNKEHVEELEHSLKKHARKEVEAFHDYEDVSGCWNLAMWASRTKIHLVHSFKELEDKDKDRAYELRGLAYQLSDMFEYIENISIEKLELMAQYKNSKAEFGLQMVNGVYLTWDLEQIKEAINSNKLTIFEVAKKLYNKLIDRNKELLENEEAI